MFISSSKGILIETLGIWALIFQNARNQFPLFGQFTDYHFYIQTLFVFCFQRDTKGCKYLPLAVNQRDAYGITINRKLPVIDPSPPFSCLFDFFLNSSFKLILLGVIYIIFI